MSHYLVKLGASWRRISVSALFLLAIPFAAAAQAAPLATLTYTGSAQTYTVPDGITSLTLHVFGGQGGIGCYGQFGRGARVDATFAVTPGEILDIAVGGSGGHAHCGDSGPVAGGWGGGAHDGGAGGVSNYYAGAGGGGASVVSRSGAELAIAGGGGGSSYDVSGGNSGSPGQNGWNSTGGQPGDQLAGGTGGTGVQPGAPGADGNGGDGGGDTSSDTAMGGGGGGGGYHGGGGGASGDYDYTDYGSGGGGGSSFVADGATAPKVTEGSSTAGKVQIFDGAPPTGGGGGSGGTAQTALIDADTVQGGDSSAEANDARNAGFEVTLVSGDEWANLTASDFAQYQVLIIGDAGCSNVTGALQNADVWAPVVMGTSVRTGSGNRVLVGTDPVLHQQPGGFALVDAGIQYAGAISGRTGLYLDTSCDYTDHVATLDALTRLSIGSGTWTESNDAPCGGSVAVVAQNDAFSTVTSGGLAGWGCSVHEVFPTYADDWTPFAVATDTPEKPTCGTDVTVEPPVAACGEAYILIAGAGTVVAAPNLSVTPTDSTGSAGGDHTVTATVSTPDNLPLADQLVGFTVTGQNAGASGVCVPADCKSAADGTVKFTYHDANGAGDDTISASFTDSNGSHQQASAARHWTAVAVTNADLELNVTGAPDPVRALDTLTLTYTITNHGPAGATNVKLTDALPAELTDVATGTTGCAISSGSLECTFASLASGDSQTVTVTGAPTRAAVPSLSTTAYASADQPDAAGSDNTDAVTVSVKSPLPVASFDSGATTGVDGSEHTYHYTLTDPGPAGTVSVDVSCGDNATLVADSATNDDTAGSFACKLGDAPGTTDVTVKATNSDGDSGPTDTRTVSITDGTPPHVSVPEDQTAEATGPDGATVTYDAPTATDAVDGPIAPECSHSSGEQFPLGVTTVDCTATDAAGNTGSASFTVTVKDTTGPAITVPDDKAVEATGPNGAVVNYSASASDLVDGVVAVTCAPASESTFALGTTKVDCSAQDAAGNPSSKSFDVTIVDTTAPVVSVPADKTVDATSTDGAAVTYSGASASDLVDGSVPVTCSPASGSTFPVGTTKVTCKATDAAGNEGSSSFNVTVVDPITVSALAVNATEGAAYSGKVATFTAPGSAAPASAYTATVDWGDGTASSAGVVSGPVSGVFSVAGTHTYTDESPSAGFPVKVTITRASISATGSSTAKVADAAIHATAIRVVTPVAFNGPMATFTDDGSGPLSDFSATIDWGDGSAPGAGTVSLVAGKLTVKGSHTYVSGSYTATVKITDVGGSTATVKPGVIAYAPATPAGGTFAISDKMAATPGSPPPTITFWGSQWEKLNPFLKGTGSSGFKGFVPAPARGAYGCAAPGSSWSEATTGATSTPPSKIPAYMSVIVVSKESKSGSTISGDVVHMVVVKVNSGYTPDPATAGKGTVVATIC